VLPFWREAALLPYGEGEMCMPGRDEGPGVLVTYDRGRSWDERGGPHLTQTRLTHLIEGSVALVDDEVGLGFWGLGFCVLGLGLGVWGLGFRV
jgi:hypothetical protein